MNKIQFITIQSKDMDGLVMTLRALDKGARADGLQVDTMDITHTPNGVEADLRVGPPALIAREYRPEVDMEVAG